MLAVNWYALNRNVFTCFLLIQWFVDTMNIWWFGIIQVLVKNLPVIVQQEIAMIPMPGSGKDKRLGQTGRFHRLTVL